MAHTLFFILSLSALYDSWPKDLICSRDDPIYNRHLCILGSSTASFIPFNWGLCFGHIDFLFHPLPIHSHIALYSVQGSGLGLLFLSSFLSPPFSHLILAQTFFSPVESSCLICMVNHVFIVFFSYLFIWEYLAGARGDAGLDWWANGKYIPGGRTGQGMRGSSRFSSWTTAFTLRHLLGSSLVFHEDCIHCIYYILLHGTWSACLFILIIQLLAL